MADASGKYQTYNLNPNPVTVNGVTYQPAQCGSSLCDPRGIGLSPVISKIWSYMPMPTDFTGAAGDGANVGGYISTIRAPLSQNSYVSRIDHDFNEKNRFFATYRYSTVTSLTTNQVDIGGLLGGTLGTPLATAPRVQKPGFLVLGLTSSITPTITNDFRWNYSRNYWQWFLTGGDAPQLPGLAGAVEIAGESANALIPYNVNTQNTRTRYWDSHDNLLKDDVTIIKGNHLIQVGGSYAHNWYQHSRTDNGQGINNSLTYQVTSSNINFGNFTYPTGMPASQQSNFNTYYSYVMGMVSQSQLVYTRSGANLNLGTDRRQHRGYQHSSLLQRLLRRHLAREAERHHLLRHELSIGDAAARNQRQPGDVDLSGRLARGDVGLHGAARKSSAGRFGL